MAQTEIRALTGLRGLAAVHVMLYHLGSSPVYRSSSNPILRLLAQGYIEVDLFFVLSGFVLALTYEGFFASGKVLRKYALFWRRRAARIYPLYCITTLAAALLIFSGWLPSRLTAGSFLANLAMVQSLGFSWSLNPPAWSLSVECAAYVVFPLLLIVLLRNRAAMTLFFWLACALSTILLVDRAQMLFRFDGLWPLLRTLLEFAQGVAAFAFYRNPTFGLKRLWPASIVVLVLLVPFCENGISIALFAPIILWLTDGTTRAARILGSRVMMYLGRRSYSIYLNHMLLSVPGIYIFKAAKAHHLPFAPLFSMALTVPLVFLLSELTFRCVELPGRAWLNGVPQRSKPAEADALQELQHSVV